MRVVIQRVKSSKVEIQGKISGEIGHGLNLLVGIAASDTETEVDWMIRKCLDLKLFPGENSNRWDYSVQDIQGEILVISQFTLYGDCRKGRRPSFSDAATPETAQLLYDQFVSKLKESNLHIATGEFGANMQVSIDNDGPVTLILER
ncbi:MAG: D-tyrosyl-tRNA(Tyr) deacylase [Cyanobacteria bacterium SW_9_44_58]|nr:MAG: D-tyrosyl-tRNA(Tyr) deacylase [Cyanobacteria bacterium SW_9_44_58]